MANRGKSVLWAAIFLALGSILNSQTTTVRAEAVKSLVVHYVNAEANPAKSSYDVAVYFSMLDTAGNSIKDLQASNITVSEDGQQMAIDSLSPAESEPMNVVLVLDTSGSMMWYNVNAVRTAAGHFIDSLNTDDQVAILTFDTNVKTLSDFTADKTTARKQVDQIQANPNSGTCMYDAVYKAVQKTAALPSGRRAIVLLTDGKDSVIGTNKPCSTYTLDDVINLASQGATRVPVFTIGLGDNADVSTLKRMSALTGGRYQFATDASKLDAMLLLLSSQLRLQYALHYTSVAAPGEHILVLKVSYQNIQDEDNRNFVLPAIPYSISFLSPLDGQDMTGKTKITVSVSGQGSAIKQVEFFVNGTSIGSDDTAPYAIDWEPAADLSGNVTILAVAQDQDNKELARSSITVKVVLSTTPAQTEISTVTPAGIFSSRSGTTLGIVIAGVILLIVVVVVVIVIGISLRQRTMNKERDRQWQAAVNPPGASGTTEKTMDGFIPSANALGVLVVLQSDDPAMIGQRIEITQPTTSLGRSANNDILFPKDSPVSRRHAVIEDRNGQLILSETLSDSGGGKVKRPTFGTFVNNKQVEDPVPLRNGDEIRLGKRVRMQFEAVESEKKDEERTIDQGPSNEDKTMDQGV